MNLSHSARILLALALPALAVGICLAIGVSLIVWLDGITSPYAWIALTVVTLAIACICVLILANRLGRIRQHPIRDLARSIRQFTVNQPFSSQSLTAIRPEFSELVDEINRLLVALQKQEQLRQQFTDDLVAKTVATETALQQEVNAHKSAQQKLQSLARQLDQSNRQLNNNLKQSQSADKAKAEFLSTMSHEIRTPLNAVLGVASLLDRSNLSDRQRQQLGMIVESGKALLSILNDIMDYVWIEAGEITLDSFPCNLHDTVGTVFRRHQELAQARGLQYQLEFDKKLPKLFLGDGARIQQLLNALIDNAVKFTHDGSVKVSVSGVSLQHFRYLVRIEVKDTGIGIPAEKRDNLFSVFSQGDSSITRAYGGSGMGLAICSRLVKLMQGNLGVESEVGRGSLFWVELPLRLYQDLSLPEVPVTS